MEKKNAFLIGDLLHKFNFIIGIAILILLTGCVTMAPLHKASLKGDINKVRTLLVGGADVNEPYRYGETSLMMAASGGYVDIVSLLIDKGADINAPGAPLTPMAAAAANGHTETVYILLDAGADVNALSRAGLTALHWATIYGQTSIVRILLDAGADPGISGGGKSPLKMAQEKGHTTIVRMLENAEKKRYGVTEEKPPAVATKKIAVKSDVDFLPYGKAKSKKNAYAIVIGIEKYREKLPDVNFATSDAQLVTKYLTKAMGYPEENVVTLLGERAARADIEKYVEKWLPNNVEKGSSVLIYYSGHGAPDPTTGDAFIVPYNGDPTFIDETGYPLSRLYRVLDRLPAKQIVVMLDSCFSGAGGRSVIAEGARPIVVKMKESIKVGKRTVVLSASSGNQISSTYDEKGHGLFTYFMLKGLKGEGDTNRDGRIDTNELFNYIKPNVTRIARKQYNNEQTPQMISPKGRNIFLMEGVK